MHHAGQARVLNNSGQAHRLPHPLIGSRSVCSPKPCALSPKYLPETFLLALENVDLLLVLSGVGNRLG
jgi:hypothetical protein